MLFFPNFYGLFKEKTKKDKYLNSQLSIAIFFIMF